MPWQNDDNKNIRGPRDQIYVSPTETWEIDYFITQYLEKKQLKNSDQLREVLQRIITAYPGNRPIQRDELEKHLNKILGI